MWRISDIRVDCTFCEKPFNKINNKKLWNLFSPENILVMPLYARNLERPIAFFVHRAPFQIRNLHRKKSNWRWKWNWRQCRRTSCSSLNRNSDLWPSKPKCWNENGKNGKNASGNSAKLLHEKHGKTNFSNNVKHHEKEYGTKVLIWNLIFRTYSTISPFSSSTLVISFNVSVTLRRMP